MVITAKVERRYIRSNKIVISLELDECVFNYS